MNQIILAINPASYPEGEKRDRQNLAMAILATNAPENVRLIYMGSVVQAFRDIQIPLCFEQCLTPAGDIHVLESSKDFIKNNRDLPYIKKIFDICSTYSSDYIGYMNSDILIQKGFFDIFGQEADAYIFYRKEISMRILFATRFNQGTFDYIWGGDKHPGNDAFFFKTDWWCQNRDKFHDDLILGETEWDTVYREVIKHETDNYVESRSLCHIFHEAKWTLDSPGALNNIKIWEETKRKYEI